MDGAGSVPYILAMNLDKIRERFVGEFRPFSLRTSDGREYAIRHPQALMYGPRGVVVLDRDGAFVILDAIHVVALKDLRAKRNGGSRA